MRKIFTKIVLIAAVFAFTFSAQAQVISIDSARSLQVGDTCTISGIVTNGSELGTIRYMQDATAGIGIYDYNVTLNRGDSITISGEIDEYNMLMEMKNISNYTVHSSNNPLPTPQIITPNGLDETVEGELVKIENCTFTTNPGGTFSSNTAYDFTSNGETSSIYVRSNHPLIGEIIPTGVVSITGLGSQFDYSNPTAGYQLIPRDTNDIVSSSTISIVSPVSQSNITQSSFDLSWQTDVDGSTEIFYGSTPNLGNHMGVIGTTSNHTISLSGLTASEIVYVNAFSVKGSDTAFAQTKVFITQSNSSGDIKVYFNTLVDHSVATHKQAVTLPNAIDDTLIAYIDRAQESIDFTMYNFTTPNISNVATALNNANSRGVTVRVIFDGSATNTGVQQLDAAIKKINNTGSTGIMHNKFIIIDAHHSNPDVPLVWTGATNLTDGQINDDPNDVIIIQDKSLAQAYTLEFNEMFGSTTPTPDNTMAKFGENKSDNTPHKFIIGGRDVELYFSPSDNTNDKLIETIQSADNNMSIGTMLITRSDITYAIEDAVNDNGVNTQILVNHQNDCSTLAWSNLSALLGDDIQDDSQLPHIWHHKFMIVDEGTTSDPVLFTGSHNWSNSANNVNDENTLIIYDDTLANIYLQAFKQRFNENLYYAVEDITENNAAMKLFPNPSNGLTNLLIDSKTAQEAVINVYDINGSIKFKQSIKLNSGINNIKVNFDLSKGMYLVNVVGDKEAYTQKLIIE